jgi:S-adenosylmethionine synthetase
MRKTSEWVSLGHPDKMADYISSFILDRYLERDPLTRYALEVQIKDNFVTLGGEITSQANFTEDELALFVKIAVAQIGYTKCYQNIWGAENTICDQDLVVTHHIGQQSPDIAQGVDNSGWGDQGIFWGMAVNDPATNFMPKDHYLARKIGQQLYDIKYAGLDIKTQVTLFDDEPEEIVVALPMLPKHSEQDVANAVQFCCNGKTNYKLVVNGTGKFVKHGPIGDCGTTGRKLAVDFYGGNCRIGGGSPWTKDGSKADLTLNLLSNRWFHVWRENETSNEKMELFAQRRYLWFIFF